MPPSRKFYEVSRGEARATRSQREIHEACKITCCSVARRRHDFEQSSSPIARKPQKLYCSFGHEAKLHEQLSKSASVQSAGAIGLEEVFSRPSAPRSLALSAVKGEHRAQHLFTALLATVEGDNKRLHDEWLATAIEYKVRWERELTRRAREGITGPEPLPHPDDIIIDMNTDSVRVKGPMTKEDKVVWDQLRARKVDSDKTIAELKQMLRDNPDYEHRDLVMEDLEFERTIRAKIARVIPD
jgi:hypothetical protein